MRLRRNNSSSTGRPESSLERELKKAQSKLATIELRQKMKKMQAKERRRTNKLYQLFEEMVGDVLEGKL